MQRGSANFNLPMKWNGKWTERQALTHLPNKMFNSWGHVSPYLMSYTWNLKGDFFGSKQWLRFYKLCAVKPLHSLYWVQQALAQIMYAIWLLNGMPKRNKFSLCTRLTLSPSLIFSVVNLSLKDFTILSVVEINFLFHGWMMTDVLKVGFICFFPELNILLLRTIKISNYVYMGN